MEKMFKENYKFIIVLILLVFCFTIHFPYYIDTPGGINDVSSKIEIDGYKSKGSFNLAYVKEYRATIPTLIISLFNNDWNVYKKEEMLLENETDESYLSRDKILMQESISNAISVAYNYAGKKIEIKDNKIYVLYIDKAANTDLKVGDEIITINNQNIYSKEDIANILERLNENDKIDITVKNKDKEYNRHAYIKVEDNSKKIGILVSNIREYETNPKIKVNVDSNESGSSGGLITTLSIYNSLVKEDITHGLTIVGTGTIDLDGNVGSIGGVKYKLKSAVKSKADLFIVPIGENYEEAIKEKEDNNYDIEIISVSTFEETLKYLERIK